MGVNVSIVSSGLVQSQRVVIPNATFKTFTSVLTGIEILPAPVTPGNAYALVMGVLSMNVVNGGGYTWAGTAGAPGFINDSFDVQSSLLPDFGLIINRAGPFIERIAFTVGDIRGATTAPPGTYFSPVTLKANEPLRFCMDFRDSAAPLGGGSNNNQIIFTMLYAELAVGF